MANENQKVYEHLNFDGFHMDQLGDRGNRYTYDGSPLNLAQTYQPFIEAMRTANPEKKIVLNAVNQYGQQGIAGSTADFLYTEVWSQTTPMPIWLISFSKTTPSATMQKTRCWRLT